MSDSFTQNPDPPAAQVDITPPAQARIVAVRHSTLVLRPLDRFAPQVQT